MTIFNVIDWYTELDRLGGVSYNPCLDRSGSFGVNGVGAIWAYEVWFRNLHHLGYWSLFPA